jgi:SagB-type dehydrogenase family enzyme
MLEASDTRSLALLYHLNSEPWLDAEADPPFAFGSDVEELPPGGRTVPLPDVETPSALADLIGRRSSCRDFEAKALALDDLAGLLAGTYGLTGTLPAPGGVEMSTRAVPSAGALYPLELNLLLRDVEPLEDGVYRYDPTEHALELRRPHVALATVAEFMIAAPALENTNAIVFITAVFDRTMHKYGQRGYRYILFEAGHAAQNLCLLATERGLGALCVGGFMDAGLNHFLELDQRVGGVVYCVGIGHPA